MIESITSRKNPLISRLSKLSSKKERDEQQLFRLDGIKLFSEAVKSNIKIEYIFATAKMLELIDTGIDAKVFEVTDEVISKLTEEKAPQGIVAFARPFQTLPFPETLPSSFNALLLSSIQDPGNLGTIIRTAYAFGVDRLFITPDCADIYSPKVIRAAMGTLFRQKITVANDLDTAKKLKELGGSVYAAALRESAMVVGNFKLPQRVCFAVGNEGHGLSDALINLCTGAVIIPMTPDCESLNAAGAAGILSWEMRKSK